MLGVVPLIARFEWVNTTRLYLFADSGTGVYNLAETADVAARAEEWRLARHAVLEYDAFYQGRDPRRAAPPVDAGLRGAGSGVDNPRRRVDPGFLTGVRRTA
ncbi:MAG TPA: hypothetical protein VMS55_00985 [Myxococcota bacterium]|nr:hypothetical protein [Myxococcota bacterium]